jgi:hypothetical protein
MDQFDESVGYLQGALEALHTAVKTMKNETDDIDRLNDILQNKALFDVLPERMVLQRPLKIRKMVKPMIEKDKVVLDGMLNKYRKKKQVLQQQSKILQLKLETLNS